MLIGEQEVVATMLDLSESGMAIVTAYDIPKEAVVLIKFTLYRIDKDAKVKVYGPMEITGEVRYNILLEDKTHRLGIYFTKIDQKDRVEIAGFVQHALNG